MPGAWTLIPTTANAQPAAAVYHRGQASGIVVLSVTTTGISRVVEFQDPALVAAFGFPSGIEKREPTAHP